MPGNLLHGRDNLVWVCSELPPGLVIDLGRSSSQSHLQSSAHLLLPPRDGVRIPGGVHKAGFLQRHQSDANLRSVTEQRMPVFKFWVCQPVVRPASPGQQLATPILRVGLVAHQAEGYAAYWHYELRRMLVEIFNQVIAAPLTAGCRIAFAMDHRAPGGHGKPNLV